MKNKRIIKVLIPALLLLAAAVSVEAQQNPFLSTGTTPQANEQAGNTSVENPAPVSNTGVKTGPFYNSSFMRRVRETQKRFQAWISEYISDYRDSGNTGPLFSFLWFSYLYGLLHVLGPGHRKIFLFSYFISQPSRWRRGMFAGFMTAVLHALSSVILIGGLYAATSKALLSRFNNLTPVIEKICYGAIAAVGSVIIISQIISAVRKIPDAGEKQNNSTIIFIIASGMVPCPGAATIMIFSIAMGAPLTGVYAVLAMSLGMATVLTFIPPAAILFRSRLTPMISKWNPKTGEIIHRVLSIAGAAALVLLGLLFLV